MYISYLRIFLTVSSRLYADNSINNWPFLPLPANDNDYTYRSLRYRHLKRALTPFVRAHQSAQTQVVSFVRILEQLLDIIITVHTHSDV